MSKTPPISDDATSPLKSVVQTYPAKLLLVCVFFGPFWVLGLMMLANKCLPAADAATFKNLLITCLTSLVVGGGGGTIASSLLSRWAKLMTQHANATSFPPTAAPSLSNYPLTA